MTFPTKLYFVTNAETKFLDYQFLLGNYVDLRWAHQRLNDMMTQSLTVLVRHKVAQAQTHLPFLPFIVEQTNLRLNAWQGLPGNVTGIFIDRLGVEGICKMLHAFEDRRATVVTELAYYDGKSEIKVFRGYVEGTISQEPRGIEKYGWYQIFIPGNEQLTFGEMSLEQRNNDSSRRQVVTQFVETVFKQKNVNEALQMKVELRELMITYFQITDLKSLCFELGVDEENLSFSNKIRFAEEIISHCTKFGKMAQLLQCLRRIRPQVAWPNIK